VIFFSFLVISPLISLQNSGPLTGTAKQQGAQIVHVFLERTFLVIFEAHAYALSRHIYKTFADLLHP
jgi:hypothetical protein